MKVAVLGAGAIGAYVGAALHRGGTEVHLIARRAHLAAMREHGVRVLSPRGDFTAHPHVTDDPAEVGHVDFVFLGLKANSYAACGPLLAPLLGPDTAVVAAQNGIPWWYFHGLAGTSARRAAGRDRRPGRLGHRRARAAARDRLRRLLLHGHRGTGRDPAPGRHPVLPRRAGRRDLRPRARCSARR